MNLSISSKSLLIRRSGLFGNVGDYTRRFDFKKQPFVEDNSAIIKKQPRPWIAWVTRLCMYAHDSL